MRSHFRHYSYQFSIAVVAIALSAVAFVATAAAQDDKASLKARGEAEYAAARELLESETTEGAAAALPKFLAAAELFKQADAVPEQAESLLLAGRSAENMGDPDRAIELYNSSLPVYRSAQGYEGEAFALNNIATIHFTRGEIALAGPIYEQAEKIVTEHSVATVEAMVTGNLGAYYDAIGEKEKAVKMYRRSTDAARAIGDRNAEAYGLNYLGKVQNDLGARRSAIEFYEAALDIARELEIVDLELNVLNNIGTVWHYLGDNVKALEYYRQSLKKIEESGLDRQLSLVLNNIGKSHDALGNKQEALEHFAKAFPLAVKNNDRGLQAVILINNGNVFFSLKEIERAKTDYDKALSLARSVGDRGREAIILLAIGNVHQEREDYEQAIKSFLAALELAEITLDVTLGATILNNLGLIYIDAGDTKSAREIFDKALPITRETGNRELEARVLNNIGQAYAHDGDARKAVEFYVNSLAVSRSISDNSGEAGSLANLMYSWDSLKNRNVAIFFGKQSVNVYQSQRGRITGLDTAVQRSYLDSVAPTYRKLAALLIAAGRIAEAEQILTMLKKEELIDFSTRDDRVSRDLLGSVALSADEKAAIGRYSALADKMTSIGAEFAALDEERRSVPASEFSKKARYDELRTQLSDATAAFEKFLEDLKIRYGQRDARVVQADSGLQRTLDRLKAHRTAAVTTILGEKGIHLIVTTSKTQRAHYIEIEEEKVGKLIADLRAVLTSPRFDPRPASSAVYDLLVKPIEGDLAGIRADTIVWSLDGALRYIPPAVLWTKEKGYLAERFANVVVSLASRETLALPAGAGKDWSVLGVGVSKATEGFDPLFAVPDELGCIVADPATRTASKQCPTGVLPGKQLLDETFTLAGFESELGRYPVVHIASHFQLTPGDDKNSFLLLGGGSDRKFTIDRLRNQSLTDVDLIVLSACNTATPGGARSNGIEIEGFGSIAHEAGAKSVIATLWSVFDTSTKDVMVEFYRIYGEGKVTKAEALRRAQITVMNGKYAPSEGAAKRSSDIIVFEDDENERSPFTPDPKAPFAHPYYWSPFLLMGNWR